MSVEDAASLSPPERLSPHALLDQAKAEAIRQAEKPGIRQLKAVLRKYKLSQVDIEQAMNDLIADALTDHLALELGEGQQDVQDVGRIAILGLHLLASEGASPAAAMAAASRKRGMWMGGFVPMGYRVENRKLVVHEAEAATIRMIFERFLKVGSATVLVRSLNAEGVRMRPDKPIDKGYIYKVLNNRTYFGLAVHKGTAYPGEHQAIIDQALWDKVHSILQESPRARACRTRAETPALLKGLLFGPTGRAMSPTQTRRSGGRLYRY